MHGVVRLTNALFKVSGTVAGIVFLAAVAINFANVIGRYFFHTSIFWAEEIIVYGIIWCVMLGAALVCWQGQHLRVEIIEMFLSKPHVARLRTTVLVVVCVVALITTYLGFEFVGLVASMDQRSVVTRLPMVVPFAAVPIGFLLIVIASVVRLIQRFRAMDQLDENSDPDAIERGAIRNDDHEVAL
jgi:TRAP-type C4-dicarboxylate transport system permease small subunit